ncbi:PucR family transcriptional regulator ligand-binding domain-containing protein [Leucobacter albus]|uniref:helix-turn-helix domain-containing protein n=1 Tax=Leucobacter albus TaxID=272210 RepID=UPI0031D1261E
MVNSMRSAAPAVTIGDIVVDRDLAVECVVMPDGGLLRSVTWVHATEQLDPRPHLRRSEIVCTLGSALVREHSARFFVESLVAAGVAGVALGLGEVHLAAPAELVSECERQGLPLLLLPHGIPFLAVNDAILRHRSRIEVEARRQEAELMSQLMTAARNGSSESAMLAVVDGEYGGRIEVGDRLGVPTWLGQGAGPSEGFLEQLGSVIELIRLERERETVEAFAQAGQLVGLIGEGLAHPAALLPELDRCGVGSSQLRVSHWPTGSEGPLTDKWPNAFIGVVAEGVVMIADASDPEEFRELGLVCGYSGVVRMEEMRRALSEARSALRLARSRGGIAGPDALVSLGALLEQQPADRLVPFIERLVAPLVAADSRGRGELVRTLTVFFEQEHHLQRTAAELYVHVNTVRQRFARIKDLVDRDPLSPGECADLRIALWAAERRRVIRRRLTQPLA